MPDITLEALAERVAALEAQLALMQQTRVAPRFKDWRRTLGMFAGDEMMKEIDRLGREYRSAQTAEADE